MFNVETTASVIQWSAHLSVPARRLWVGAVGLHHRGVPPDAWAPLRGRVSGVPLLQSHGGENTRLADVMQREKKKKCDSIQFIVMCLFFFFLNKTGFSQGVRRSVGGLATILGPLWAGGLTNNLYIMLGMMLALLIMITVSRPQLLRVFIASDWHKFGRMINWNSIFFPPSCQEWYEKIDAAVMLL